MIFALLFAALFALSVGGSPYLAPKMDKYMKKSLVDKEREKQVLIHQNRLFIVSNVRNSEK